MKKLAVILALAVVGVMGLAASTGLGATEFWKHLVTSTTVSTVQHTTTAPMITVKNQDGYYYREIHGKQKCEFKHDPPDHANWNGPYTDANCSVPAISVVDVPVTSTSVVTVCNDNPDGAVSGPYSDENCTNLVTTNETTTGETTTGETTTNETTTGETTTNETTTTEEGGNPPPIPVIVYDRGPNHVFLCYSKFQVDPGAWVYKQAVTLYESGYWEPFAVASSTASHTLLKGHDGVVYSLVCNTTLKPTGKVIGDAGEIRLVDPAYGLGFAQIVK